MYNSLKKSVTCDTCGTSVPVKAHSISSAKWATAKEGWTYAGLGAFSCPACPTKKSVKKTRAQK